MAALLFNTPFEHKKFRNVIENGVPYVGQDLGISKASSYEPPAGYKLVAESGQTIVFDKATDVAYGANGKFSFLSGQVGNILFDRATFGDPVVGIYKAGYAKIEPEPVALLDAALAGHPEEEAEVPAVVTTTNSKKYIGAGIGIIALIAIILIYKKMKSKK